MISYLRGATTIVIDMSQEGKNYLLSVRFTEAQKEWLEESEKSTRLKRAEVVRKCVDLVRSGDPLLVSLLPAFMEEVEDYAAQLEVTPGEAVGMMVIAFMTFMKTPLWKIVRPVDEVIQMLVEEKKGEC